MENQFLDRVKDLLYSKSPGQRGKAVFILALASINIKKLSDRIYKLGFWHSISHIFFRTFDNYEDWTLKNVNRSLNSILNRAIVEGDEELLLTEYEDLLREINYYLPEKIKIEFKKIMKSNMSDKVWNNFLDLIDYEAKNNKFLKENQGKEPNWKRLDPIHQIAQLFLMDEDNQYKVLLKTAGHYIYEYFKGKNISEEYKQKQLFITRVLGSFDEKETLSIMIQAAGDKDARIRWAAIQSIGSLYKAEMLWFIKKGLGDESLAVRFISLLSIAQTDGPEAAGVLKDVLEKGDINLRRDLHIILGESKRDDALSFLLWAAPFELDRAMQKSIGNALMRLFEPAKKFQAFDDKGFVFSYLRNAIDIFMKVKASKISYLVPFARRGIINIKNEISKLPENFDNHHWEAQKRKNQPGMGLFEKCWVEISEGSLPRWINGKPVSDSDFDQNLSTRLRTYSCLLDSDAAIKENSFDAQTYINHISILFDLGYHQLALSDLNYLILRVPDYHEAYYFRASIHLRSGKYAAAIKDCNQGLKGDSWRSDEMQKIRAEACLASGKYKKSIEDFNRLLYNSCEDSDIFYGLCCAYSAMGEREKAMDYLEKTFGNNDYPCDILEDMKTNVLLDPLRDQGFFKKIMLSYNSLLR
ncbi:MAG: hypothetical protein JXR70_17010 [Spirochaetales bacterium]|nr:hypothetical protein [Spirochaetales bacterium]